MNYQHDFHAGNAADVLKHLVLMGVLTSLRKKDAPFIYFDTHAGGGKYDLTAEAACKTGEFQSGIGNLWSRRDAQETPANIRDYLALVARDNSNANLRWYPGSPCIAGEVMRPQDRLVLIERQAEVAARLRATMRDDARVAVHQRDGYEALKSLLPPRDIKRGVVLIDPPYEDHAEFQRAAEALTAAARRWAAGVFLLWYPVTAGAEDLAMLEWLKNSGLRDLLVVEWCWHACRLPGGMNGSGMVILHPPWQFDLAARPLLEWLHHCIAPDPSAGQVRVEWWVPE